MIKAFKDLPSYLMVLFVFLLFFFHLYPAHSQEASELDFGTVGDHSRGGETTGGGLFNGGLWSGLRFSKLMNTANELEKKIICALESNGLPKEGQNLSPGQRNQRERAKYVAKHLGGLLTRLVDPEWRDLQTQHMVAQMVSETGTLRNVVELRSQYASSRSAYKGRGACQTTHRENFAKLEGCTRAVEQNPPPARVSQRTIAAAPPIPMRNPAYSMKENTRRGQMLNAMSCACYFIDTAKRHSLFSNALRCSTDLCVHEVGVAVNRGPGDLGKGKRPLSAGHRLSAFKKMSPCFQKGTRQF